MRRGVRIGHVVNSRHILLLSFDNNWNSVAQAGLKLRDLPASASKVLGLKACAAAATTRLWAFFNEGGTQCLEDRLAGKGLALERSLVKY